MTSAQKLVVLFDGTWNDPQDQTNVYRMASALHGFGPAGQAQRFYYDPGVGTGKWDRIRGGVLGQGLSKNLMEGYEWLCKRYTDGDEIWVFGFSRGAYTARSLCGLLRKCGLLKVFTPSLLQEAETLYRDTEISPDHPKAVAFRENFSREVKVHFLGVWDTVGALGVPGSLLFGERRYGWHNTELSTHVLNAFQALALDEYRGEYAASLWVHPRADAPKVYKGQVEQRWFVGAHSNVGGGYGLQDPLPLISLRWMQERAQSCGLGLNVVDVPDLAWQAPITDSFGEFMWGAYAQVKAWLSKGSGRHVRAYDRGRDNCLAVNVTVDPSVWQRWQHGKALYRPATLINAGMNPPEE